MAFKFHRPPTKGTIASSKRLAATCRQIQSGWVADLDGPAKGLIRIQVVRLSRGGREVLAETTVRNKPPPHDNMRAEVCIDFQVSVAEPVAAKGLAFEQIVVIAVNAIGTTGSIRLDGAEQVSIIMDMLGPSFEPVAKINFAEGGNLLIPRLTDDYSWPGRVA